jgi:hypothetical protein
MIVKDLEDSEEFLQRVIVSLFVGWSIFRYLFIYLFEQRSEFQVEELEPLKDSYLFLLALPSQAVPCQIKQDRVGLVQSPVRSNENKRIIFFVDLLSIDLEIEETDYYLSL